MSDDRTYWKPADADPAAPTEPLSSEWTDLGHLSTAGLTLEATEVNLDTLSLLTGSNFAPREPGKIVIERSVVIEHVDHVPGGPEIPAAIPRPPWWQWRARRVRERAVFKAWEVYFTELNQWVADGKPDKEIITRTYMPRAMIFPTDDGFTVTARG